MTRGQAGSTEQVLAQLRAAVSALGEVDLGEVDGQSGPGLHAELSRLAGRVQAVAARVLARVESDGRWQADTTRTFAQWVARREGTSIGAARRETALGEALDGALPHAAAAVASGSMPLEHAEILARHAASSEARRAALASEDDRINEASLVNQAHRMGADQFRKTVKRWAHTVDSDAAEAEHAEASAREHLTLTRRTDGVALSGFLTLEHGEALRVALDAVTGVPAKDDPRSLDQRQAAALVDATRLVLDHGLAGGGQSVRPHLSVHVTLESLVRQLDAAAHRDAAAGGSLDWLPDDWRSGGLGDWSVSAPAELDDGTPIPPSLFARLACDSEVSRIVFGPEGQVLDVGRAKRTFTGQQRRAVVARDRTCQFPDCGAPPGLGEVHHVDWWARDHGDTDVGRGILLCWHHHDVTHQRRLRITRDRERWRFWRADGREIVSAHSPGKEAPPTVIDDVLPISA